MNTGLSVSELLDRADVSWLTLDGWHGRIGIPVVVIERGADTCRVRLLRSMAVNGRRYAAGTIKSGVPSDAVFDSFVGSLPPELLPAETAP